MAFEKIKMTEKQLIKRTFYGKQEVYGAFKIFQKYNVGMTEFDHMIMDVKINVKIISNPSEPPAVPKK